MRRIPLFLLPLLAVSLWAQPSQAFCGFFVAKADTNLFNEASKVVIVRDGDRTVLTMANDFKGEPKEFAMVIPVPTFIEEGQIHVTENKILDHLDAYTAPRLVEYFDEDPCEMRHLVMESVARNGGGRARDQKKSNSQKEGLGVTIEAEYTVGEYDILILSAKESDGLETWLNREGYKVPKGASKVLDGYLKQKMRFFVAKVNLKEQSKLGFTYLRPIQVAYESPKFMLPIRLGTVNANGPQELFVYALTRTGRVETTNYRTVKLPSNVNIPPYVKDEFGDFYTSMFTNQVTKNNMSTVFLEYAWDMNWCDPCAADPLSDKELQELGVWWTKGSGGRRGGKSAARNVFVSRLHVRYDAKTFPEDLVFQATSDRQNFQGRYIMQHPWDGSPDECDEAASYFEQLYERQEKEAETLAELTGWKLATIRKKMKLGAGPKKAKTQWWERLWDE